MKLVGAHVLEGQLVRRSAEEGAEVLHRVDVDALGCGRHVAQGHVVDHALAQGRDLLGHGELPSSGLQDQAILSDRRSRANGIEDLTTLKIVSSDWTRRGSPWVRD